jgi:protease I
MNAVILVTNGVQDEEFIYPYYRLKELGKVTSVGVGKMETYKGRTVVFGKYGIPCNVDDHIGNLVNPIGGHVKWLPDILVVPGGWECPEVLRMEPLVLEYVRACHHAKKIIASICHGPQVLISAGILKGKTATAYKGIKDDIRNAGATYADANVVVSDNIITSPHYNNNPEWMAKVVEQYILKSAVIH